MCLTRTSFITITTIAAAAVVTIARIAEVSLAVTILMIVTFLVELATLVSVGPPSVHGRRSIEVGVKVVGPSVHAEWRSPAIHWVAVRANHFAVVETVRVWRRRREAVVVKSRPVSIKVLKGRSIHDMAVIPRVGHPTAVDKLRLVRTSIGTFIMAIGVPMVRRIFHVIVVVAKVIVVCAVETAIAVDVRRLTSSCISSLRVVVIGRTSLVVGVVVVLLIASVGSAILPVPEARAVVCNIAVRSRAQPPTLG